MSYRTRKLKTDATGKTPVPQAFSDKDGDFEAIKSIDGAMTVNLTGNSMEFYGATVDQRPAANEVPVGACYMAVNTQDVWQSNGFQWIEV
ncbi:hypothetical protein BEP19_14800 [Ammoniphilus oxalaticus]|uniref:Uncharacterized protein n=1 Tax=Ammoniphilus oxalaticus TaxID=66863 RepID=A0A419SE77_9BACL|nr:hypothetical protein [Ammoniphilus oxalaticus]RKD21487.1 hypothetical protein BEP19_14800 [Ammoniphilus oxalaticus]